MQIGLFNLRPICIKIILSFLSNYDTMASFYNGMKYDSLQARYEGHVGNRNPILGIGHVAYDEPQYDVEGRTGPGSVSLICFFNPNTSCYWHVLTIHYSYLFNY
jgi:hypothetical protein